MKTLVLTGWSVHCAVAATVALYAKPDASVKGISKRRLPLLLKQLASQEDAPDEIFLIGTSLYGDTATITKASKKLVKEKGTKISWLSVLDTPLPEKLTLWIKTEVNTDVGLDDHVAGCLGLRRNNAFRGIIRKLLSAETDADGRRMDLIKASGSRYRRFQDDEALEQSLRTIAENRPLNDAQLLMIEEYRRYGHRELKGVSDWTQKIRSLAKRVGKEGNCRVLITGETGTGKETVAILIHGHSPRRFEPFVEFSCADLSPQLIESRLFGHEKGAFTGAERTHIGLFEEADGGTLFLDEVGELPLSVQAGLLRVIQEKRFRRLGGMDDIEVDVRIITATNRALPVMVKNGTFREDLLHRISVVHLHIPPLRQRTEDISVIADNLQLSMSLSRLTQKQHQQLVDYPWPGNVRELQNVLDRARILGNTDFSALLTEQRKFLAEAVTIESDRLDDAVRLHVRTVLDKHNGNRTHAAKAMNISVNTLKKHIKD